MPVLRSLLSSVVLALLLCAALAACAETNTKSASQNDSLSLPKQYDDSALSDEDAADFSDAQKIWNDATNLSLFGEGANAVAAYESFDGDVLGQAHSNGDIYFSADYPFGTNCPGNSGHNQFRTVSLHELGHVLGLSHVDDPHSVMYPLPQHCRTPSQSDVDTVRSLWAERLDP